MAQTGDKRRHRNRRRLWSIQLLVLLALAVVVARIRFVQSVFGPRLTLAATQVEDGTQVLMAPRGSILDSNGQPLAYDIPAFIMDVNANTFPHDPQRLATLLAAPLGVSAATLLPLLQPLESGTHHWLQWPHPVLEPAEQEIQTLLGRAVPGQSAGAWVTFTPTEQRFYPDGTLAGNSIGYVNGQGVGEAGLELEYNHLLAGTDGSLSYTVNGYGVPIQSSEHVDVPAKAGDSIELNMNRTIQGYVEHEMQEIVQKYHPEHATAIVMDPKTGAILAISSYPNYNPNTYWTAPESTLSDNWAVNAVFEPGSTFKFGVMAAALATHSISLGQTFMSGHKIVDGVQINDWNWVGWGRITFEEALEKSSNVGFATIALRLGWPNLMHYLQKFGYLAPTGIDLPGEATSIIFPPSERGPVQLATAGFGQGIAVTPLQQMAALSAILNGGNVMRPEMVKAIINPQTGKVLRTIAPHVNDAHVVPASIAQTVERILIKDVHKGGQGIDQIGYIPGYEVGGKSGTAQTVNRATGQYYANQYSVSFLTFAPGWDPQFEVYVNVYRPHAPTATTWGSTISGPFARDILQECLQFFHVAPRGSSATVATTVAPADRYVQAPNLVGLSAAQATQQAARSHLSVDVLGQGEIVQQWPQAGVEVPAGSTLYLAPAAANGGYRMPAMRGASLREVADMLAALGISLTAQGSGFVTAQSVPAGALLHPGQSVEVTFAPPAGVSG